MIEDDFDIYASRSCKQLATIDSDSDSGDGRRGGTASILLGTSNKRRKLERNAPRHAIELVDAADNSDDDIEDLTDYKRGEASEVRVPSLSFFLSQVRLLKYMW